MDKLTQILEHHGIALDPSTIPGLDRYRRQLWAWNERLNLTRHTTLEKFVTRDVADSWQLAQLLPPGDRVLDVGTGGGVPGLIMAIVRPDLRVSLCESVAKKAKAVEAIVGELELDVPVYHARAEDVLEVRTFDTLVARAVAPMKKILRWFNPHWGSIGQILMIKGKSWTDERGEARHLGLLSGLNLRRACVYNTPGTDAESVILRIWPETGDH